MLWGFTGTRYRHFVKAKGLRLCRLADAVVLMPCRVPVDGRVLALGHMRRHALCPHLLHAVPRVEAAVGLQRARPEPLHPSVARQDPPGLLVPALVQQPRLGGRAALVRLMAQPPPMLKSAADGRLRALAANTVWPNRAYPLPWSRRRCPFIGKSPGSKLRSIKSNLGNRWNNRVYASSSQKKR